MQHGSLILEAEQLRARAVSNCATHETFRWLVSYQLVHDANVRDFGVRLELSQMRTVGRDGEG